MHSDENRRNLENAYRVLLTRARLGMAQLPVMADTSAAIAGFNLNCNALATASLIALFER